MAGKTSTLTVRIVSDARSAAAGFSQADSSVGKFTDGLDRMSVKAGVALAAVAGVAKQAYDAASKLQQSTGAVEAVFGAQADGVKRQADQAAKNVGLSANSYQEMASVIGSQLRNMGIAQDQLVPKTQGLISLGADLSAVYGGTAADAVEALSAVLRGETDPIERYGVSIKQATIQTQLAADGHAKLKGQALQAAQAQAVLELLTAQTSTATGQFAAQANTAAEKTQIASAQFENAKAALGNALLPVVIQASNALGGFAGWAQQNSGDVQVLVGVVGGLAAAVLLVNGALATYKAIATVATAAQWLLNIALDANPIGLIVIGIASLVVIVVSLYNRFAWFRDLVKEVWSWITKLANIMSFGLVNKINSMQSGPNGPAVRTAPAPAGGGMWGAVAPAGGGMWGAVAPAANIGTLALPSSQLTPGDTWNVTIQGAVDKEGTADQLRKLAAARDAQTGRVSTIRMGLVR